MKLCECGCGEATAIAATTQAKTGRRQGVHNRYINGHYRRRLAPTFWPHVRKAGPDECWPWTGLALTPPRMPYGRLKAYGKAFAAHRYSWELHFGPIPEGLCVLHRCDNPPCVNPAHLFLGTPQDNNRDRQEKGRTGRGERKGSLTVEQVRTIRARLRAGGVSQEALAAEYGIAQSQVSRIYLRRKWAHLDAAGA